MERILLATHSCPNCKIAAKKMTDMGVAFVEKFAEEEDGKAIAISERVMTVPVLFVTDDDGNKTKYDNISSILGYLKTL